MFRTITLSLLLILFAAGAHAADLKEFKPISPEDNDKLIAEYMASKDTIYIRNMLDTYAEADDSILKDARRFAYLSTLFKNPKSPRPDMQKTASIAVCEKYKCASDQKLSNQFMMISSGMWALDSISEQDKKIKEAVGSFLNDNERIKKIYAEESAIFSSYWTFTVLLAAKIDVVKYSELDTILTTYEKLGSLDIERVHDMLGMKRMGQ